MTNRIDEALKNLDKIIKLDKEKMELEKRLRLALTIEKHFPEGVKVNQFFVITREDYRKGFMHEFRHSPLEVPKLKRVLYNGSDKPDPSNVIIMDVITREFIEIKGFELPKGKNNIHVFRFGSKKRSKKK